MTNDFRKDGINFRGILFIRNDVYELLLSHTPDRGKLSRVNLDWTDSELMIEILRRRFIWAPNNTSIQTSNGVDFAVIWHQVADSHIADGEESSHYLIERCLMRPRCLIDILQQCKSCAVNLGHDKIKSEDFHKGEAAYSADLVHHIGLEIEDVFPNASDCLYWFISSKRWISGIDLETLLKKRLGVELSELRKLLLWYGFLGFVRPDTAEETYIYNVAYDMKRLTALIDASSSVHYCINPAFHLGLEISD